LGGSEAWCGLIDGDVSIGVKRKGTALEHFAGKVPHHGFGLDVEITKHFVRAPTSNKANRVRVDLGAHERHGASGTEAARCNVRGIEAQSGWAEGGHSGFESSGDVPGEDFPELAGFVVAGQWGRRRCVVFA